MQAELTRQGLERLRQPLPVTEVQGLESVDPRLVHLSTLADKGQLAELAQEVEILFAEGVYDIRPISLYLWATFAEDGLMALPVIFETLTSMVSENLHAIGPSRKRDDHIAKRVAWLMQKLTDSIEYHDTRRTDEWAQWTAAAGADVIEHALEKADTFDSALGPSFAAIRMPFQKLTARLRALSASLIAPPPPVFSIAAPVVASAAPPSYRASPKDMPVDARLGRVELGVSHEFFALVQKLEAFAKLSKKGELARAAIVADDLMHLIESFDPRMYFPEVFSEFSELMSKHIGGLAEQWHDKDSPTWRARAQFYRVDLRRFVDGG